MTLTNREIREAVPALNILQGRKLPVAPAFKLKRNLKVLGAIADQIEEDRQELLKKYAKLDDKGEIVKATNTDGKEIAIFDGDNEAAFQVAFNDLLDTELEDIVIQRVTIESLREVELEPVLLIDFIFEAGE